MVAVVLYCWDHHLVAVAVVFQRAIFVAVAAKKHALLCEQMISSDFCSVFCYQLVYFVIC